MFDEPSIGLHPLDVQVLLKVFQALLDNGATVIVIEHDLDVIRNADYVIDMGPGGGENGGKIIASGTPQEIKLNKKSITEAYLLNKAPIFIIENRCFLLYIPYYFTSAVFAYEYFMYKYIANGFAFVCVCVFPLL